MPHTLDPFDKNHAISFELLLKPLTEAMVGMTPLESGCNRPLQMSFEEHLRTLVFFHLEEHTSARHLLQVLEEDDFARAVVAPSEGIKKSSFSEATNERGLRQFMHVFENLQAQASRVLPNHHADLGNLVGIDGSLIDATLSMYWADYRKGAKKAKVHVGFDLNRSIPRKVFLTDGNRAERPFVSQILSPGDTGVLDRGYQSHKKFDQWQGEDIFFMCRVKASTRKAIVKANPTKTGSIVFYDAVVLLGSKGINQTEKPLRLVGYEVDNVKYWIATNRLDLSAEQIAAAYKLRWDIENFFAWWKRHLKVYHLIARSEHGLMVQILSGLITYLLLAIYCHEKHKEKVSVKRVRQLRISIQNELRAATLNAGISHDFKEQNNWYTYAKT